MLETDFVKLVVLASNDDMSIGQSHSRNPKKIVVSSQILIPFFFPIPVNRSRLYIISATSKHLP
jgi:hypothetical protein